MAAPLFADGTNQFADDNARVSYAYGMLTSQQWKQQDVGFDTDAYSRGIKDGAAGTTQLTTEQAQEAFNNFRKEFPIKMAARQKAVGEAFLTTNQINPGIKLLSVTLPTGQTSQLQYLVLTNGTGLQPAASDTVTVNYRGTLLNGVEFDSSFKAGHPVSFEVGKVIPGWTAALQKMAVGSKWKLFIPSELAYGAQGNRGIPPNSVLIFEVELLATQATPPPPPPAPAATQIAPLTSDIIKVPSAEEMKKGAQPEIMKPEDVQKAQSQQNQQKQ